MIKPYFKYILTGAIAFIIFLVLTIPANFIHAQIKETLPAKLYQVDGTLWSGRAETLIAPNGFRVQAISWEFRPLSLLLGKISIDTKFITEGGYGNLTLNRGLFGGLNLSDIDIKMPITDLKPFLQTVPVDLKGVLDGQLEEIEFSDNMKVASASGRLTWNHAVIDALSELKIGDFTLALEPTDDGTKGVIKSKEGGPLEMNGILQLNVDGHYDFKGELKAKARAPRELKQALQFIGKADPTGKIPLKTSGTL
ncbi:MAG TPA: type II secretion system protein N [Gammaproteobacteria bacterium]|nr:type II secretion system protein N [Gammaproteobacteria bacterium]